MAEILDRLKVYGFSRQEEMVIFASLLTGEPLLLVGTIGSSKTTLVRKLGRLLNVKTGIFNTANGQFEDILGFINPKDLGQGIVSYVETPVTIWGKQLVLLDEINRPNPATSNKWLDFLADREMLGAPTGNIWRIGAMNPMSTQGTSKMGEATVGRFGSFVYVPEFLGMSSTDRLAVIKTLTSQNLPGLNHWAAGASGTDGVDYNELGAQLKQLMTKAAGHFRYLEGRLDGLDRFIDKFVLTVSQQFAKREKKGKEPDSVSLDGRRVGLLRRVLIGTRAIELSMADIYGTPVRPLAETVRQSIKYALPFGVNSETGRDAESLKIIESAVTSLLPFLTEDQDLTKLELHFELLTTTNVFRKLEILLSEPDLDKVVQNAGWTQITKEQSFGAAVVGLVALTVEAQVPGSIPPNSLDGLTKLLDGAPLEPRVMYLRGPHMLPFAHQLEGVLKQDNLLGKIIAAGKVNEFVDSHAGLGSAEINDGEIKKLEKDVNSLVRAASNLGPVVERLLSARKKGRTAQSGATGQSVALVA